VAIERCRRVLSGRTGLRFAFLFGSVARGQSGPLSDVDIAVHHDPAAPDLLALQAALAEALDTDRLDLVELNGAGPLLRHRVLRDGVAILIQDQEALFHARYRTQIDYLDTAPLRAAWWKEFRTRWASKRAPRTHGT
jgi:predicted nucleotidyltransferase